MLQFAHFCVQSTLKFLQRRCAGVCLCQEELVKSYKLRIRLRLMIIYISGRLLMMFIGEPQYPKWLHNSLVGFSPKHIWVYSKEIDLNDACFCTKYRYYYILNEYILAYRLCCLIILVNFLVRIYPRYALLTIFRRTG